MCPRRRRKIAATALGLGYFIGLCRLIEGAHWPSDVVYSGVLTLGAVYALHRLVFWGAKPIPADAVEAPRVGALAILAKMRKFLL